MPFVGLHISIHIYFVFKDSGKRLLTEYYQPFYLSFEKLS